MKRVLLGVVGLLLLASVAAAQEASAPTPDARVKAALDQLGLIYTVSENGNFRLVYDLDDGRTQLVVVYSTTDQWRHFDIREVVSTGYLSNGPLSDELANRLLDANRINKLGAWRTYTEGDSVYVNYAIQIPADADAESLRGAIEFAMNEADELEKELSDKDDL